MCRCKCLLVGAIETRRRTNWRQLISNFFNGSIWICLPTLVQLLFVFVDFFFVFFKNSLINFQVLPRLWCYKSSWNQRSVHAGLTLRSGQLKCSTSYWEKYNLKPLTVVIAPCNFSPPTQNFTREQLSDITQQWQHSWGGGRKYL